MIRVKTKNREEKGIIITVIVCSDITITVVKEIVMSNTMTIVTGCVFADWVQ